MGGAPGRIAAAAAALWLAAGAARPQDEAVLSPAYLSVLKRYASGDRSAALTEIAAWPEGRLRREMTSLASLRRAGRACNGCGAQHVWQGLPVRAGLMLHADAALGDWRAGRPARLAESAALPPGLHGRGQILNLES
ncbi:MAG: hypothetical protein U0599_18400 [Vicinamibacteria bacterium]